MRLFSQVLIAFLSLQVQADVWGPAELDIKCVPAQLRAGPAFTIVSNKNGSAVVLSGKAFPGQQLTAGTEGGPAYLQVVSNEGGFNITISGGDLVKSFDLGTRIENGTASANVNLFNKNKNYQAICKGLFSFER